MNEKWIKELVLQADRKAGSPRIPDGLAGRVRQKAQRQRRLRAVKPIAAAAAMVVLAAGISLWSKNRSTNPIPAYEEAVVEPSESVAGPTGGMQIRMEQLRAEVNARMAALEEMLARQEQRAQLAQLERKLAARVDPLEQVRRQLDKAAFIVVYQADRKYNKLDLKESAIADYQQVIKLFGQTRWAKQAQKRLAEIETNRKGNIL